MGGQFSPEPPCAADEIEWQCRPYLEHWAHNPKVEGSNPSPATKSPQQLTGIEYLPYRPTSTFTSTFRSGFRFWCVICGQAKSTDTSVGRWLCWNGMHVDAKGTVGRYPVLLVRSALRHLRSRLQWGLAELEAAAGLVPGNGRARVRVLRAEGLIEAVGRGIWTMTQAGVTFSAATAAQQVTRATAERTLSEFLERVTEVNQNPYFLAKVTTVVQTRGGTVERR